MDINLIVEKSLERRGMTQPVKVMSCTGNLSLKLQVDRPWWGCFTRLEGKQPDALT